MSHAESRSLSTKVHFKGILAALTFPAARSASDFAAAGFLAAVLLAAVHTPAQAQGIQRTVCPTCPYQSIITAVTSGITYPLAQPLTITVSAPSGTHYEYVSFNNRDGQAGSRLTIKTDGSPVILDGSDDYTNTPTTNKWFQSEDPTDDEDIFWADITATPMSPPGSQVFVNGVRYARRTVPHQQLTSNEYTVDQGAFRVYVNTGAGNPGQWPTYIGNSTRPRGFNITNSNYVTLDGFTVVRCGEEGINIRGTNTGPPIPPSSSPTPAVADTNVRGVIVTNCIARQNWKRGIHLRNGVECTISNNTTSDNGGHGIQFADVGTRSVISNNVSYGNIKPDDQWGGITGIKVGQDGGTEPDLVSYVTVDYNRLYDNQDTGIELQGAKWILVRRNVSYSNGDHGYDNNATRHTVFMNNVAADNDHNGISVENTSQSVEVYNCILAYNAQNARTLAATENVAELWVHGTVDFQSNNNLIFGEGPFGYVFLPEYPDTRRRSLVEHGTTSPYFWDNLSEYTLHTGKDAQSVSSTPLFASMATGDFKISSHLSAVLERAKTDIVAPPNPDNWTSPWWLSVDPRGFVPHDNDAIVNGESGSPNFADIGAYEFDIPPSVTQFFEVDMVTTSSITLMWGASGDDYMVGRPPTVSLRRGYYPITEAGGGGSIPWGTAAPVSPQPSMPVDPYSTQIHTVTGLNSCTTYHFGLKYGGGNGLWAPLGTTPYAQTTGSCGGGGCVPPPCMSDRAALAREEATPRSGATALPYGVAPAASGTALIVEAVPGETGLDLRVVALDERIAAGYEGDGGGVICQALDGAGGWATLARYALPPGDTLALLAPKRARRWVFLEPLALRAVLADDESWQLEQANHSRLGDMTNVAAARQRPALGPGDTLAAHYVPTSAGVESLNSYLLVIDKPTGGTDPARAGRVGSNVPTSFALHQNQPNPFEVTTTFRFDLPRAERVRLEVFDVAGRKIAKVRDAWMPGGQHSLEWDRRNDSGSSVRPGTYLYRLSAGGFRAEKKLVVLP